MTSDGPLSAYWWMNGYMQVVEKEHVSWYENGVGVTDKLLSEYNILNALT